MSKQMMKMVEVPMNRLMRRVEEVLMNCSMMTAGMKMVTKRMSCLNTNYLKRAAMRMMARNMTKGRTEVALKSSWMMTTRRRMEESRMRRRNETSGMMVERTNLWTRKTKMKWTWRMTMGHLRTIRLHMVR
ncbi:hypothetical protein AUJ46_04535 [Candidatus Peregrinibacteria bacterium CG1_02_54_53]|nr:MAG: hypothetical protein AUJ46_04535 [Candidatus Peregrinibacteria bacterium CG1_02_54_53]